MHDTALIIIARAPELNRVKTRLAERIGGIGALHVYRQLLAVVTAVQASWTGPVLLTSSGDETTWKSTGLAHLPLRYQPFGGLGSRIAAALDWGLAMAPRSIAIGTDCPGLRTAHLARLAALLDDASVAFGPAEDGGYWGVAVADPRTIPIISGDDLPWSTPGLLAASRHRLTCAGIAAETGDILADCDDADDLAAAVAAGYLRWPSQKELMEGAPRSQ